MRIYEALAVFCQHTRFHNTLLFVLERRALAYLRPTLCWRQVEDFDNLPVARLCRERPGCPSIEDLIKQSAWNPLDMIYPNWQLSPKSSFHLAKYNRDPSTHCCSMMACAAGAMFYNRLDLLEKLLPVLRAEIGLVPIPDQDIHDLRAEVADLQLPDQVLELLQAECPLPTMLSIMILLDYPILIDTPDQYFNWIPGWLLPHQQALDILLTLCCRYDAGHILEKLMDLGYSCPSTLLQTALAKKAWNAAQVLVTKLDWNWDAMLAVIEDDLDNKDEILIWMSKQGCPFPHRETPISQLHKLIPIGQHLQRLGVDLDMSWTEEIPKLIAKRRSRDLIVALELIALAKGLSVDYQVGTDLLLCAAEFGIEKLNKAINFIPLKRADGRIWQRAALAQRQDVLDLLASCKHTWKTKTNIKWSLLCDVIDWRWLHAHGSPCRVKH